MRDTIIIKFVEGKGRGLFANEMIFTGEVIHVAELIVIPKKDVKLIEKTILDHYVYEYDKDQLCIALGFGSLFNHDKKANIDYSFEEVDGRYVLVYTANKLIDVGEEFTIDYGYEVK